MTSSIRVGVTGRGVVGSRIVRRLPTLLGDVRVVPLDARNPALVDDDSSSNLAAVVLAHGGPHSELAHRYIDRGVAVISVGDDLDDVRLLLSLDHVARDAGVPLVVGAGMTSGLVGLVARYLTMQLASVDEIHIAVHGTAGPACARQHHRALAGTAIGWQLGLETTRRAGTARELAWFPEPVGPYDCYLAELSAPILVRRTFPEVTRISARMSANRRDRLTSRLPMLTPPHREGGVGAIRVEVRGAEAGGARSTLIAGVAELVGTATAATAVTFAERAAERALEPGVVIPGHVSLDTPGLLRSIEKVGVRLQEFTGVPSA